VLNVCLICSLLIVKVIFVITVFCLFLLCVSTILVNKDDHYLCIEYICCDLRNGLNAVDDGDVLIFSLHSCQAVIVTRR